MPFSEAQSDQVKLQHGVITQKVGADFIFVFPSAVPRPSGRISIGKTIEIIYALQITKGGRNARFVAVDATALSQRRMRGFNPALQVLNKGSADLGFYIKDTSQLRLNININSAFTREIGKKAVQQKIGREGNLNVVIGKGEKVKFKIIKVDIN